MPSCRNAFALYPIFTLYSVFSLWQEESEGRDSSKKGRARKASRQAAEAKVPDDDDALLEDALEEEARPSVQVLAPPMPATFAPVCSWY